MFKGPSKKFITLTSAGQGQNEATDENKSSAFWYWGKRERKRAPAHSLLSLFHLSAVSALLTPSTCAKPSNKESPTRLAMKHLLENEISVFRMVLFYCSAIRSVLEYACMLLHRSLPRCLFEDLERIQKRAMGIILPDYKYRDALKTANIDTLYDRRESLSITFDWLSHYIYSYHFQTR